MFSNEKNKKLLECCQNWVSSFNAIPIDVVKCVSEYGAGKFVLLSDILEDDYFDLCNSSGVPLPIWSTLWTFGESSDEEFFRDNIKLMSDCGFLVYDSEIFDSLVFGINGAGYSFFDSHWIPLYNARGLKWHLYN